MRTITQIREFTSLNKLNTFLSTANQSITYVDLKVDGDNYLLIFIIEIHD